jgi:hypothetical protein
LTKLYGADRGGERKKGKEKDGNRKRKIKREIEGGHGERKKERETPSETRPKQ